MTSGWGRLCPRGDPESRAWGQGPGGSLKGPRELGFMGGKSSARGAGLQTLQSISGRENISHKGPGRRVSGLRRRGARDLGWHRGRASEAP